MASRYTKHPAGERVWYGVYGFARNSPADRLDALGNYDVPVHNLTEFDAEACFRGLEAHRTALREELERLKAAAAGEDLDAICTLDINLGLPSVITDIIDEGGLKGRSIWYNPNHPVRRDALGIPYFKFRVWEYFVAPQTRKTCTQHISYKLECKSWCSDGSEMDLPILTPYFVIEAEYDCASVFEGTLAGIESTERFEEARTEHFLRTPRLPFDTVVTTDEVF